MNTKPKDDKDPVDDQPSTSTGKTTAEKESTDVEKNDEEMMQLLKVTDEILENKAKSMNLSSLNVRSILHHLIKYPQTIDVLLGIRENESDIPSVRNTRSRKKPDGSEPSTAVNTPKKFALRIEDKGPKSFLDLEYEEDDEFDADYVEENSQSKNDHPEVEDSEEDYENYDDDEDEEEEEEEEEDDVDEEVVVQEELEEIDTEKLDQILSKSANATMVHNDTLHEILFNENPQEKSRSMNLTLNDTLEDTIAPVPTLDNVVDDEDYRNFVKSLQCPSNEFEPPNGYDTEDDAEDEDYNVIADNLNLNVDDRDEIRQDKTTMIPRHEVKGLVMDTLLAEKEFPVNALPERAIHLDEAKKSQKEKDAEVCERLNVSVASSSESCSLLGGTVTFRPQELEQLQLQLTQHVQLLTQFVVTCHHDVELAHVRNSAQLMLNQLDDIRNQQYPTIMYDIQNLDGAIESCHDINAFDPVHNDLVHWQQNTESQFGPALRPEAAAVLARSRAIRFPALLPPVQPSMINRPLPFLQEEDVMLAIALLQFTHLPRRAEKGCMDRYTAIHSHCLPARSAFKIRNHLKTMRRNSKNPSPIHAIIQNAENGVCSITIPNKIWRFLDGPIETWDIADQPNWFRGFQKTFNVTEDRKIHRKTEEKIVLTPVKRADGSVAPTPNKQTEDSEEFFEVGVGPGGQTVIMDKDHIQELMNRLIRENEISPSKRRKNRTPIKLSQEEDGQSQVDHNIAGPSTSSTLSKASRKLACVQEYKSEIIVEHSHNKKSSNARIERSTVLTEFSNQPEEQARQELPKSLKSEHNDEFSNESHLQSSTVHNNDSPSPVDESSNQSEQHNDPEILNMDYNTCSSYPIPLTPGKGPADDDEEMFLDLESNSLLWTEVPYFQIPQGNPLTPGSYPNTCDPTDFSSMVSSDVQYVHPVSSSSPCQRPMGYSSDVPEYSNSSSSIPEEAVYEPAEQHRTVSESTPDDEASIPGLDIVPQEDDEDVEEYNLKSGEAPIRQGLVSSRPPLRTQKQAIVSGDPNVKASRKRTRMERETMGSTGLLDEAFHEDQKAAVMRKVIDDVNQRLFMYKDTWIRFSAVMTDEKLSDIEKIPKIIETLSHHPELLNLVLLYAPESALPPTFHNDPGFKSYKAAVEMILDIERYITAAKLKEPTLRSLFRFIRSFLEDDPGMTSINAASRFFQLFGQEKPLWKKLETHFWALPFKHNPPLEKYEYIDLTEADKVLTKKEKREKNSVPAQFETIDDIDQVMSTCYRPPKLESNARTSLVVKCGEFCIRNENDDTYTQLEITERRWTRKDDIALLTRYNEAVHSDPTFTESKVPSLVPDLQFGEKSVIARLHYLLTELKYLN